MHSNNSPGVTRLNRLIVSNSAASYDRHAHIVETIKQYLSQSSTFKIMFTKVIFQS